jgi:NYN domain
VGDGRFDGNGDGNAGRQQSAEMGATVQPRTIVYVDGFNLYYGSVKRTAYKWLDVRKLVRLLLPQHDVAHVHYFTARVKAAPYDIQQPARQEVYLRALRTLPNFSIHFGSFQQHPKWLPLEVPAGGQTHARVLVTKEKGSDVNLATLLLIDAHDRRFQQAVVVSNDSDFELPIRIVQTKLGLPVGVLHPHREGSVQLRKAAAFFRPIPRGALAACQFSSTMRDSVGRFTKPSTWA